MRTSRLSALFALAVIVAAPAFGFGCALAMCAAVEETAETGHCGGAAHSPATGYEAIEAGCCTEKAVDPVAVGSKKLEAGPLATVAVAAVPVPPTVGTGAVEIPAAAGSPPDLTLLHAALLL